MRSVQREAFRDEYLAWSSGEPIRGVATCTHGRTCVTEKMSKKGNSGFICSTCAEQKENIQRIILEFTGKNDRTLSLCL